MIHIGLTGSIGAGKSTVGRFFEEWGAFRIDADELAREAVRPGSQALERIRREWGSAVIDERGELNRAAMRRIASEDPAARKRLEGFVHPEVGKLRSVGRERAEKQGSRVVVEEVPLLFEVGLEGEFDLVVVVDAPLALRRKRVCETRGLSAEDFEALNAAQWIPEKKRSRADHLIWNARGLAALERQAKGVWKVVSGEARAAQPPRWTMDLHMHSCYSYDCLTKPAELVRQARVVGLDRIAVTDHNEIRGAFETAKLAPELVIVGEEVRTDEGLDVVGLFLSRWIAPGGTFREVAEEIRRQGGIVYLPHPFDAHRGADEAFFDQVADVVDLVEGFNARVHDPARNAKAREWARRLGLPVAAGSDAHLLKEIGRGCLRLPPFAGPDDFLAAVARGTVEGTASGWSVHLGSTWAKLRKRLT